MSRGVRIFCCVAGAGDLATGVLLMFAPLTTVGLMRIETTPLEPVYLRFVGAFVAAVGSLYLYPFLSRSRRLRDLRLRTVLEATALVRATIATFLAVALIGGELELAWMSVLITDGTLATIQIMMLTGGLADAR
jgi:hypothetical protein